MLPLIALLAAQAANTPPTAVLSLPKQVASHATFDAKLALTFAPGLHGYQNPPSDQFEIPVTVKLVKGDARLVSVKYPKGTDMTMAGDSKPTRVYTGTVPILVHLTAGTKGGELVLQVDYQQCNEASCYPPAQVRAKANLAVGKKKG